MSIDNNKLKDSWSSYIVHKPHLFGVLGKVISRRNSEIFLEILISGSRSTQGEGAIEGIGEPKGGSLQGR